MMPTLLFKDFGLVKGVGFDSWRRVGSAMQAIKVYNLREVDELIFLDITATTKRREPDYAMVDELADDCFMPMTVGGGVQNLEHVRRLLQVGADKVAINSAAVTNPALIGQIAQRFGSQCCVVSIDARKTGADQYRVFTHAGTQATDFTPVQLAKEAQRRGAGEILLTSIPRDGSMEGYDLELIRQVTAVVDIPVIASGGAGNYQHLYEALTDAHACAVAAASIFHFTEQTPLEAKQYLSDRGIAVRL